MKYPPILKVKCKICGNKSNPYKWYHYHDEWGCVDWGVFNPIDGIHDWLDKGGIDPNWIILKDERIYEKT